MLGYLRRCPRHVMMRAVASSRRPRPTPLAAAAATPLAAWVPRLGLFCLSVAVLAISCSGAGACLLQTPASAQEEGTPRSQSQSQSRSRSSSRSWLLRRRQGRKGGAWRQALFLLCLGLVLAFSFLCGTATLRKRVVADSDRFLLNEMSFLAPFGSKEITYNHRETDELIFETLTATVSKNLWDYSLQSSGVIDSFQLSRENYDDDVFIHPPFFVYSMLALLRGCGVPLVLAGALFHVLTAALVAPLLLLLRCPLLPMAHAGDVNASTLHPTALWAAVVFVMCPIARITSQKIWIDNAAAFTATLAAVTHLSLLRNSRNLTRSAVRYRNCASGLFYGLIALNCKITALAMLPFLLSWTTMTGVFAHRGAASSPGSSASSGAAATSFVPGVDVRAVAGDCCCFLVGMACGHGPWVYLYYVSAFLIILLLSLPSLVFFVLTLVVRLPVCLCAQSITGRLLPNAWPSRQMIERSLYLQAAMSRNTAAYLIDLFKFSPLQLVGLLLGLAAVVCVSVSLLLQLLKRGRGGGGGVEAGESLKAKDSQRELSLESCALASFSLWPLGFVAGLTLIGALGGGFQVRFIVPLLPATSVLASLAVARADSALQPLAAVLLVYAAMHCLFYAVLYSPLFADMHATVFDIIRTILESPHEAPATDMHFMKHFGLKLD